MFDFSAEYVDQVLSYASDKATEYADSADLHSAATQANMLDLLLSPIKAYFSLFTALALPHYLPLFSSQTYSTRRSVAGEVARNILKNRIKITTSEHLEGVLSLLKVLIKEGIQHPGGYPGLSNRSRGGETDETLEEQGWLARIVHLIQGPDNDTQLKVSYSSYSSLDFSANDAI
jgi:vacuolar protein sorting-associated protein 35